MAEPNIVKGQIALDPVNDLLYYVNESNTIIATSLSWLKNDNNISTVENVVISGDLTVSGTTFTVNTETLLIEDNIIVLNSNYSGNAETDVNAKNAGIEVERGTQPNVLIRWNESTNKWQFSNDGTSYYNILGEGNVNLTLGADTTGNYVSSLVAGTGITLTNNSGEGATPTIAVNTSVIAPLASPTFTGTVSGVTKTMVGLGNVDNTSDANKPVSTATQTALDLKAPLASPTFTGTVAGVTKTMVGLGNVDNTSDANKPVSTATQTALDLKAPLASPTFTGTVAGITATMVGLGNVNNTSDANKPISTATQTALDLKAPLGSPTFTGTVTIPTGASITAPTGLVKSDVGLGNVDNTSDANKPVSTATQTALDLKANLASPVFTSTVTVPTLIVDGIEIDTTSAATGQVLKFNGTKFAPGTDDTTTPGALGSIDGHTDVTISTPITDGQVLILDNNVWVNDNIVLNNIVDFNINNIVLENEVLKFDGQNWVNSTLNLGTDTNGAYIQSLVAGTGITLSNNLGFESATPTISVTANTYDSYGSAAAAATNAATALANHEADTTNIHGIVDTSILVTTTGTQTLTNKTITSPQGLAKGDVGLGNVDNTSDANKPVSAATQTALNLKANLASPTFTGTVTLPSDTVVTATIANAAVSTAKLADDAVTSSKIADGTIVNADINASANIDKTKISGTAITAADTGTVTSAMIADNTIIDADISATAAIDLGKLADATIDIKTANYTLVLTDKNKFIKMNIGSANTLTVPLASAASFPVGSQIHIIQYGSGKTQIVGTAGVTVYGTPGLYLRAQYSSATLLKCADTNVWMLMGDLSAS